MKPPISYRKGIPFFYKKSETDYQKDPYEKYYEMVVKHLALHLADDLWGQYPMQPVIDFGETFYSIYEKPNILEIGCGVGRWIGNLAQRFPNAQCWGIDFSYQMLKQAELFWMKGEAITIDLARKGFVEKISLEGHELNNLQFGLAKAESLPFNNESQDLVLSSFLLDRLEEPTDGLMEMHRVLKRAGTLIAVTPLNFYQAKHWRTYFPPVKLTFILNQIGFEILDWQEGIIIHEPMDAQGNAVNWNCIGFIAKKKV